MKEKLIKAALIAVSAIGILGMFTTQASAAWSDCGTNRLCAWDLANGGNPKMGTAF
jgi:hypothetical protein